MTTPIDSADAALERTKWEAEKAFREREIALKEREQTAREAEIDLKCKQHTASQWSNPLIVAILAASIAAIGTTAVALVNGVSGRKIEAQKSEQARILEMIKTGDPEKASRNLKFLLDAGLIVDPKTSKQLKAYLAKTDPANGPVLPSANSSAGLTSNQKVKLVAEITKFQKLVESVGDPERKQALQNQLKVLENLRDEANN